MIKDVIKYLNNRIEALGYFNEVFCLAEKIKRDGNSYPAQYNSNNEYERINLDVNGSICYWRKSGDVNFAQGNNESSIGKQYTATIPLKLVGFLKKEQGINDQYLADNICLSLISNLTVNNSALKQMLKAKTAVIHATRTITDPKTVANDEYDGIEYEPRYTHAYFSIEFELVFTTNNQCYTDVCANLPFDWGYVTVTDNGTVTKVQCGMAYTCTPIVGGTATVKNSDLSYLQAVNAGDTLLLNDIHFYINVNGVLNQSFDYPAMKDLVLNIS